MDSNLPLLPWYAHLIGGHAVTGLFPWFLVSRQLLNRGKKIPGLTVLLVNIVFFCSLCIFAAVTHLTWDYLLLIMVCSNFLWSMAAWVTQRRLFGPAQRRYYLSEWRSWVSPILIALILGTGLSVIHGLFPIIGERIQMIRSQDLVTTRVLLWDLFRYTPIYLPYSLLVGIWWSGERNRFSPASIVSYLAGLLVFSGFFSLFSWLFFFLLFKGDYGMVKTGWSLLPRDFTGIAHTLYSIFDKDITAFAIVPLLIGAAPRVRDFWKRSLAYFPVISVCYLGLGFFTPNVWQIFQNQIFYELSSADTDQRQRAYSRLDLLLDRFPQHEANAELTLELADYLYGQGDIEKAREKYRRLSTQNRKARDIFSTGEIAAAALSAPESNTPSPGAMLKLPMISYAPYMTANWMALLRVSRFYQEETMTESAMLIRLKELSTDEKSIKLSPMPSLAELDDNAGNLGLSVLILPADIQTIQALITAGFPVILPIRQSFVLIHGFDDSRSAVVGSLYRDVPLGLKDNSREDIDTTFSEQSEENAGKRRQRVEYLSRFLLPLSFWGSKRQLDLAPYIAVAFSPDALTAVAGALGQEASRLEQGSKAKLAALISLNALRSGDIAQSIEWAQRSSHLENSPLPMYSAHLASLLWKTRENMPNAGFPLQQKFPLLSEVQKELNKPETSIYLAEAAKRFADDLQTGALPWMIRREYQDLLDRSDQTDMKILLSIADQDVLSSPDERIAWLVRASLHEWQEDYDAMQTDLQGALEAGEWDDSLALDICSLMIKTEKFNAAEPLLKMIAADKVKFNADYYYCKAMIAKWRGERAAAKKNFEKALAMRRFSPQYHLDYARFLLETGGDHDKATKALQWAAKIDAQGSVQQAASTLLATITTKSAQ